MRGIWHHIRLSLRLHFRNRMALLYGYLFPVIFLISFWVLYRYERVPLILHMGELLTVTILGGACFGLPTTIVSERERGVWRRFRLAPVSAGGLVASTLLARYVLLLTAGLLQLALAMALGMPMPAQPLDLLAVFTVASFAFLGLGLVIAMLADNVPAVQALGQCLFLPMLIIGGVAVPLTSLPAWALHVSAYFPGRYAVEAIQAAVNGPGWQAVGFSLLALTVIGAAACIAGAGMFRWDARQRFTAAPGRGWVGVALAGWIGVGLMAHAQDRIVPQALRAEAPVAPRTGVDAGQTDAPASSIPPPVPETGGEPAMAASPDAVADPLGSAPSSATLPAAVPPPSPLPSAAPPVPSGMPPPRVPDEAAAVEREPWEDVTLDQIKEDLVFDRLPPDAGVVTPVASLERDPDPEMQEALDLMYFGLETWAPAQEADVVQRVRNLLFVPAVVDYFQMPIEPFVPLLIFDHLEQTIDRDVLLKVLYWIAVHPDEGSDAAVDQLRPLGLTNGPSEMEEVRGRVGVYAVKLIGRLTGLRPAQ